MSGKRKLFQLTLPSFNSVEMVLLHLIIDCTLYQSNYPESDLHSNEHYSSSSENKAWEKIQAFTGFEPMTFIYSQSFSNYTINNYNFEQEELL